MKHARAIEFYSYALIHLICQTIGTISFSHYPNTAKASLGGKWRFKTANSKFLMLNLQENANNKQTNNEANIPAILSEQTIAKTKCVLAG